MVRDIYSISYKMRRDLYHRIFVVLAACIICFLSVNIVMNFIVYPVNNNSTSMEIGIDQNGIILVSPLFKNPHRGDVMLVRSIPRQKRAFFVRAFDSICRFVTAQRISPFSEESLSPYLRRVVALPGDSVYIKDYMVFVKPRSKQQFLTEFELAETTYKLSIAAIPELIDKKLGATGNMEEFTLADDEYFLLGDNRLECVDCRIWGPLKKDFLLGKALLMYFPFSKARIF